MEEKKLTPEDEEFQLKVSQLREWLEQKPYVPKNVEELLYRRFIHSCYFDLDKAKTAADLFFSIRSSAPELLTDRDPLSPHMQKTFKITNFGRYRLSGDRNLWVWQLDDPGLQLYDHQLEAKMFILMSDAWLLRDDFLEEADILVSDVKDLSFKVLTKFSYSVAKKMSKYQQEAVPIRLKQIHIINAPSVIYRVFALLKPFIRKEMMDLIHIHTPQSTTLFDYLNKDEIPEDFGGTRGKLSDYAAETFASIMKDREILTDDTFWRVDAKNPKKENTKTSNKDIPNTKPAVEATKEISSLRTLSID